MGWGNRVSGAVAFLRARYPTGAPAVGYVPLLALLPRRVSEDEITTIAGALGAPGRRAVDRADVGVEITVITHEMPSLDDIARVRDRLAGGE
jgi:Protein of unknown function (DUF3349)